MMTGRQRIRTVQCNASIKASFHFIQMRITAYTQVISCLSYPVPIYPQLSLSCHHAPCPAFVYSLYCSFTGFLDFLFYLPTCHVVDVYSCVFTDQFILLAMVIWACDCKWDMRISVSNKVCMAWTRIQGLKRVALRLNNCIFIIALFVLPWCATICIDSKCHVLL
jgi:hypothetical protein